MKLGRKTLPMQREQSSAMEVAVRFEEFSFVSIQIDGVKHENDVVIDRGEIRKRKKKASKKFRDAFGHTPLSVEEDRTYAETAR
ncbi:MAG: hypothetical protein ACRD2L_02315 [Terriglobia bacterium]